MRPTIPFACALVAALTVLIATPSAVNAQSTGLRAKAFENEKPVYYSGPMPFEPDATMFGLEQGAHSFYFTAPSQPQSAAHSGAAQQDRGSARPPSGATGLSRPVEWTVGWRYTHTFANDPALSVSYNAHMTVDIGSGDITGVRGTTEYLTRFEIAREFGRLTPRAEVGYRYSPRVFDDPQSTRSRFTAAGLSYRYSDRASFDVLFDRASAPLPGTSPLRTVSLNFTQRVSSQMLFAFYAFKSLSEDRAYNAGVKLSVQF